MTGEVDRVAVREEMQAARRDFRVLVGRAGAAEMRRRSEGTRWTNRQLLFHMLFGYLLVRALLILARVFARLPVPVGKAFAWLLDSAHAPFHVVNYLASCAGARVVSPARMPAMMDGVVGALERSLQGKTSAGLRRGMYYPTRWDPFFTTYMTVADIYHYPTLHFRFHQRQLTLTPPTGQGSAAR